MSARGRSTGMLTLLATITLLFGVLAPSALAGTGQPASTSPPAVTGTARSGDVLAASSGGWSGTTPMTYTYQWLRCNANGDGCSDISGATSSSYTLTRQDVGSALEVSVTASNSDGSGTAASAVTGLVEPATGPDCSDAWLGPASANWSTAADWSTGSVPSGTDVACVPSDTTVDVTSDDTAGSLQAADATIVASAGTLTLMSAVNPSQIGNLDLSGAKLSTAGPLQIDSGLGWTVGTMTGTGSVTLAPGSTSTITPADIDDSPTLDGIALTNSGTLTLDCADPTDSLGASVLVGAAGASISNLGTLALGTGSSQLCALTQGTGISAALMNSGTATIGASTFVGWAFDNGSTGQISVANGGLYLGGGETQGASELGTWPTDVSFVAGTYDMASSSGSAYTSVSVGYGSGDSDPFDALLGADPTPVSLTYPACLNCWLDIYSGNATFGSTSTASTLGGIQYGGNLTEESSSTAQSTSNGINVYGGRETLDGDWAGGWVGVGLGGPQSPSTLVLNGVTYTNELQIDPGGTVQQNGTLYAEGNIQGTSSEVPGSPATVDGSGNIIWPASNSEYSGAVVGGGLTIEDQTITNENTDGGLFWLNDTPNVLRNVTVDNDGLMLFVVSDMVADGGVRVNNAGTLQTNGALLSRALGEHGASLTNDSTGTMEPAPGAGSPSPTLVEWPFSNAGGTVDESAYEFESGTTGVYGGANPASPHLQVTTCGDPVVCATGDQTERETDMSLGGLGGLGLTRTYNSQLAASQIAPGMFGFGWTSSFEAHLWLDSTGGTAVVQQPDGSTAGFTVSQDGSFVPDTGVEASLTQSGDGSYTYTEPDQSALTFSSVGQLGSETSRTGLVTTLQHDGFCPDKCVWSW